MTNAAVQTRKQSLFQQVYGLTVRDVALWALAGPAALGVLANFLDAADLGVLLERAVLGYARLSVAAWAWLSAYLPDWIEFSTGNKHSLTMGLMMLLAAVRRTPPPDSLLALSEASYVRQLSVWILLGAPVAAISFAFLVMGNPNVGFSWGTAAKYALMSVPLGYILLLVVDRNRAGRSTAIIGVAIGAVLMGVLQNVFGEIRWVTIICLNAFYVCTAICAIRNYKAPLGICVVSAGLLVADWIAAKVAPIITAWFNANGI